ncbi:hypothetical protein CONPUDRAFT_70511 [Coniophora puteana RWD-64-598 SS2]|uniref:Uncharacterized protein n=1 Tax=Coniophora puteana (strain RWD-64-598) TaxID=741705 RepID=A0A5M3N4P1_CONPW|nr:uncharacterized protein CONPUDRAFT_70511 [Coniophora puteana RWD-64-598 SS2]EIW85805.1 hypothetical protein CONPUDRAFT_70511 [Coniophora puteana RWD-64-598 SS2]
MYSKYPWLALAEDDWKVDYLGKDSFPNFKRSYLDDLGNIRPEILAKMEDNPEAAEAILKDSESTSASSQGARSKAAKSSKRSRSPSADEATVSTKRAKGKGKEKENDPAPPPPPSPEAISDQDNLDDPNPMGVGADEVTRQDSPVIEREDALAIDPTDCTRVSNVERDDIPENRDEEVFEPHTFPSDSPDANEEGSCESSPLPWLEKERAEREQSERAATTNACASGLPADHAAASRQKVATPTEPRTTAAPAPSQDLEQEPLPRMLPVLKFKLSKKAIPAVPSEEATHEQDICSQVHTSASSTSTPLLVSPPVTKTTRSTARKSAAATTPSKPPSQAFKSRAQAVLENPSEYTKKSRSQSRKEGFSEPVPGAFDHKPEAGVSGQHKEEDAAKEAFDPGDKKDGRTLCAIRWLEKEKNKGSVVDEFDFARYYKNLAPGLKKKYTAEAKKLRNGRFKPTYYSQPHVRFCRMMHLYATKWSAYTHLSQTAASAAISQDSTGAEARQVEDRVEEIKQLRDASTAPGGLTEQQRAEGSGPKPFKTPFKTVSANEAENHEQPTYDAELVLLGIPLHPPRSSATPPPACLHVPVSRPSQAAGAVLELENSINVEGVNGGGGRRQGLTHTRTIIGQFKF